MFAKVLLLLLVLMPLVVLGALPPLPKEQLVQRSRLIVTGTIKSVSSEIEKQRKGFEDRVYRLEMTVESVEKGDAALKGKTIVATTWQPAERPAGWAGPQGQNVTPVEGMRVRCYLQAGENDTYSLLEPNGLEKLDSPATKPIQP